MENNKPQQNNKIENILEKIKKNELNMYSKTYFNIKFAALILVAAALCVTSIFLSSLILFTVRATGHAVLFNFGPSGWEIFLRLFPWGLFAFGIILILVLEFLLRSFKFGYKVPVLYLFFGVIALMFLSGIVVDQFKIHDNLAHLVGQHRLPSSVGKFYDSARRPPPPPFGRGIFRGTITTISGNTLQIDFDDPRKATTTSLKIMLSNREFLDSVVVGDRVFVAGDIVGGEIRARAIKKAPALIDLDR